MWYYEHLFKNNPLFSCGGIKCKGVPNPLYMLIFGRERMVMTNLFRLTLTLEYEMIIA